MYWINDCFVSTNEIGIDWIVFRDHVLNHFRYWQILVFGQCIHCFVESVGFVNPVVFPGIFYRGGAEKTIRQYLVDNNFVEAVIALPDNLFFGTSIATYILVLAKNKAEAKTLFIDATAFFKKETNNNILSQENIDTILELFTKKEDVAYQSMLIDNASIAANDYNLSVSTYVEKEDTREKIDIVQLNKDIAETVKNIDRLRAEIDKIVEELSHDQ